MPNGLMGGLKGAGVINAEKEKTPRFGRKGNIFGKKKRGRHQLFTKRRGGFGRFADVEAPMK